MGAAPECLGLVADVGGTNLRLALAGGDGRFHAEGRFHCADFPGLSAAVTAWARAQGIEALPARAAVSAAGPVTGGTVRLTNHPWVIDAAELSRTLGIAQVHVVNDFTAQALALPDLAPEDLFPISGGRADPQQTLLVLGPGTGLGVAGLLPGGGPAVGRVIDSEAGHMGLAARDAETVR
jgi:glucokinase